MLPISEVLSSLGPVEPSFGETYPPRLFRNSVLLFAFRSKEALSEGGSFIPCPGIDELFSTYSRIESALSLAIEAETGSPFYSFPGDNYSTIEIEGTIRGEENSYTSFPLNLVPEGGRGATLLLYRRTPPGLPPRLVLRFLSSDPDDEGVGTYVLPLAPLSTFVRID